MLHESCLPAMLWSEALASLVHVWNRCPTDTVDGVTPFELWHGHKLDVSYLRIWGCPAYVHVHEGELANQHVPAPEAPPATPPPEDPAPAPAPALVLHVIQAPASPVGISAQLPNRQCNPPKEWWKLSSTQINPHADEEDDEDTAMAFSTGTQTLSRSYHDATCQDDAAQWQQAAVNKLAAQKSNGTWELIPRLKNHPVIRSKWVFVKKYHADSSFKHYKARLISQGFNQCPRFKYLEVFTPTVHLSTLCIILTLAAIHDLHLWSVDISYADLNGEINCKVYME